MKRAKLRCREMLSRLSDYIDGELDASACRAIESHMPGCAPCRAFVSTLRKSVRILDRASRKDSRLPAGLRRGLREKLRECRRASRA